MKREITFNTIPICPEEVLRGILDEFEAQYNTHVNLQIISWANYRQEFTNITLHNLPGDVGAGGAPVTSDMIAMNALRPFASGEIQSLGGEEAYLPSRWRSGFRPGEAEMWAVPWMVDLRLIYYRRDLFARAGINEATAFETPQQMENTIRKLHEHGIELPWLVPFDHYAAFHRVSSFIWAFGGDLFTPDGKLATFHEKEALEGMRFYFNLMRYIPASYMESDSRQLLLEGKVGVVIENAFAAFTELPDEIGSAPVPGGSYVGGIDLLVWKQTRSEKAAMDLVRFLSRPDYTLQIGRHSNYLSPRLAELEMQAKQPGAHQKAIVQAILSGHTSPCVPMIGLVEDRLGFALLSIQQEVVKNPDVNIDQLLQQRIVPLGKRTNISLSSIQ